MSMSRSADPLRQFAISAARLLRDRHCEDIRLLDVRGLSQVCDYVLIGTGTSDRQMKSVAHELGELGEEQDNRVFRSSRDDGGTWIVIDFVDMVTHLFEPNQRAYYDIESLWSDAPQIDWERDGAKAQGKPQAKAQAKAPAATPTVETMGKTAGANARPAAKKFAKKTAKKPARKTTARSSASRVRKSRS